MRALALVVLALAAPAVAVAAPRQPSFCASEAPVDTIQVVLVCETEYDHNRHAGWPLRRIETGWEMLVADDVHRPLTAEENSHVESWLADGVAKLCKGVDDSRVHWPSVHRKEYGWPMDRCRGRQELVLTRAGVTYTLRAPRVPELAAMYWLVRIRELGLRGVWTP